MKNVNSNEIGSYGNPIKKIAKDEIIRESNLSTSCKHSMLKALWIKEDCVSMSNSKLSDFAKIPYNDWKKYLGFGVKTIKKTKEYLEKKNIPIIY